MIFDPASFDAEGFIQQTLRKEYLDKGFRYISKDQSYNFGWYAISIIHHCMRKSWKSNQNWTEMSMEGLKNTTLGNIIQDWVDNKLRETFDNLIKIERSITIPLRPITNRPIFLTGRIDHLFTPRHEEDFRFYYPIEAKYLVNRLVDDIIEVGKQYQYQIQTYMMSMGALKGSLYFIDHRLNAKTFALELNFDLIDEGFKRVIALHDWIETGECPPAEAMYSQEKWLRSQCYYCPHRTWCYEKEKKEID